ncbi:MAG TPA: hypothetical protein VJ723_05205 [Candidatus Angelobacter sp.]|nr:hypothetical protein [Candidatus Angelobacter sp.]
MKTLAAFLLCLGTQLAAQDMQPCPMHKEHSDKSHQTTVEKNGDQAMGFPHDKTAHHFRLYADGGAIEVTVNDSQDLTDLQAIRSHLAHIAKLFSNGDFAIPMFVHDQVPPGVPAMKAKRRAISYQYEEITGGARVRIQTADTAALSAIHDFLRFQIEDHHTGDTLKAGAH